MQGDVGSASDDAECSSCLAWGRDTCATILKASGVSYWGAWVMAAFLTVAAATSIVLSQRISSERQVGHIFSTQTRTSTWAHQAKIIQCHSSRCLHLCLYVSIVGHSGRTSQGLRDHLSASYVNEGLQKCILGIRKQH